MAMGDVHTQFEWPLGLSHHTRLQYTVHIRLFGWPEKFAWQSLFELLVTANGQIDSESVDSSIIYNLVYSSLGYYPV